jgi:hypothetical protein
MTTPPTARDFLAYQRIVIDTATTRQVAEELEISQTRVRQIVHRVSDFLRQTLPATDENTDAAHLRLAQHIAADRLDRYLREADEAWRNTRETKYANLIFRILAAQTKLPASPGTLEALAADAIHGPLPVSSRHTPCAVSPLTHQGPESAPPLEVSTSSPHNQIQNPQSKIPNAPPSEDCSPSPAAAPPDKPNPLTANATNPDAKTPSDNPLAAKNATRDTFLTPAHSSNTIEKNEPLTELRITSKKLSLNTTNHLNRRQRRRLRRLRSKT